MEHNLNQMHPFTAKEQKLAQRTNPIKPTVVEIYIIITRQNLIEWLKSLRFKFHYTFKYVWECG